ncbi:hypothetical protein [Gorillibacterium sp. sgz500922]|uniref:hypothetical protein n=1 Tax=Gorillibacterium sp. sgz500922 TaxID=3446694 RepID=UPI003F66EBBC
MPKEYAYAAYSAANGVELHAIQTDPDNVQLVAITNNVNAVNYYGVNGGFFYDSALLSIAVNDGIPVIGKAGDYGSGWMNVKYARGTLVWDRTVRRFSVQLASSAEDLAVTDRSRYWAQGGISMHLQDAGWHTLAEAEHMPGIDELHMRTGLLFDRDNRLRLVVTNSLCTAEEFRSALLEWKGNELLDGIFLDGDGSSQLKIKEMRLPGDSRAVRQMLALIR